MFTTEFEFDVTKITILDDTGEHNDVEISFEDDGIVLKQYDEFKEGSPEVIFMSHDMFWEMIAATQLPEGTYK